MPGAPEAYTRILANYVSRGGKSGEERRRALGSSFEHFDKLEKCWLIWKMCKTMLMFSPNLNRRKILMCARSTKPKEECYRTFIGTLFVCIRFILPSASHCPLVPFTVFVSMHNTFRLQNSTNSCAIEVFQCRGLLFLRLSINRHITRLETIIITKIKTKKKNARNLSGIERWANEQVG